MKTWQSLFLGSTFLFGAGILSGSKAREWSPTNAEKAQDYLTITDRVSQIESIFVTWVAPPMIPKDYAVTYKPFIDFVNTHVMISAEHVNWVKGKYDFDPDTTLSVTDALGNSLRPVPGASITDPPLLAQIKGYEDATIHRLDSLGPGLNFYLFSENSAEAPTNIKSVGACSKGRLTVKYAQHTYFWDTPVPGCH